MKKSFASQRTTSFPSVERVYQIPAMLTSGVPLWCQIGSDRKMAFLPNEAKLFTPKTDCNRL
jgi:hypothetical protein